MNTCYLSATKASARTRWWTDSSNCWKCLASTCSFIVTPPVGNAVSMFFVDFLFPPILYVPFRCSPYLVSCCFCFIFSFPARSCASVFISLPLFRSPPFLRHPSLFVIGFFPRQPLVCIVVASCLCSEFSTLLFFVLPLRVFYPFTLPCLPILLHFLPLVQSLSQQPTVVQGRLSYDDSPLVRAAKEGSVMVIDEADKAPIHVTCVLKTLVEDGEMLLTDGRRLVPPDFPVGLQCVQEGGDGGHQQIATGHPRARNGSHVDLTRATANTFHIFLVPFLHFFPFSARRIRCYAPILISASSSLPTVLAFRFLATTFSPQWATCFPAMPCKTRRQLPSSVCSPSTRHASLCTLWVSCAMPLLICASKQPKASSTTPIQCARCVGTFSPAFS